jgi:hypothetical protein
MDQLIKALPSLMRAAGKNHEVALAAAQAAWNHACGELLRKHTVVTGFQDRKLTVAVGDGVWKRQLERMSPQLLYRLNALLGSSEVTFIEFEVNARAVDELNNKANEPKVDSSPAPVPAELLGDAASIRDPNLRRAFLGAAGTSLRLRKKRRSTS